MMDARPQRPNPFTSVEGCFLSRTVGALFFVAGLVGGGYLGALIGYQPGAPFQPDEGARYGGALGAVVLWLVPWRRWLVRAIKAARPEDPAPPDLS